MCRFACFVDIPFFFWRVSYDFFSFSFFPFFYFNLCTVAKVSKCISAESFGRSGYIPCRIGKDGGFIRRDRSFHLPRIILAKAGRCVTDHIYPLVKNLCLCTWNSFQFESPRMKLPSTALSGRCERKTTTLWSAAPRIPWPHIRVAFSLWTD